MKKTRKEEAMQRIAEIKEELDGRTSFDKEHENNLFEAIAVMEEAEEDEDLVEGLEKIDYIFTVLLIIVAGLGPVAWYALEFF